MNIKIMTNKLIPFLFLIFSYTSIFSQECDLMMPVGRGNEVIKHDYFWLSYSEKDEQPEWVFYELTKEEANGNLARTNNFRPDSSVPTKSAQLADYKGSGFDRGHLAPAGDMEFNQTAVSESFYMSNMSPQRPGFNRGIWKSLESLVRAWAQKDGDLYIITAGVLEPNLNSIGLSKVSVPKYYYKVILDYDSNQVRSIAFLLPNQKTNLPLSNYIVTIDEVEELTGINFFAGLDKSVQESFESKNVGQWNLFAKTTHIPKSGNTTTISNTTIGQCVAVTQKGTQCKRKSTPGNEKCWQHQ